jgi:hypothetical protein
LPGDQAAGPLAVKHLAERLERAPLSWRQGTKGPLPLIVMTHVERLTLPLALSLLRGNYQADSFGPIMAGAVISAVPLLIVFLVANDRSSRAYSSAASNCDGSLCVEVHPPKISEVAGTWKVRMYLVLLVDAKLISDTTPGRLQSQTSCVEFPMP